MENKDPRTITFHYKWVMLALAWFVYLAFGVILSSISPLITPISHDLTLTYSQIGFVLGTWQLVYIPLSLLMGFLIDRVGARKSITIGMTLVSLSGLLRSFAINFETLLLSVFIFGVGGPIISVGLPKVVASWFVGKHRGTASGIYTTGSSVGCAISLALTNALIMPLVGTWRNVFGFYGIFGFLITFIWLLFGRDATPAKTDGAVLLRKAITNMLREKYVWIVAVISLLYFFACHGFRGWLPKILELKGMTPADAGYLASTPLWFGLIGGIAIPRLGKAGSRKYIVFVVLMVQGICILITGLAIGLPLIASLVFYGISASATTPLLLTVLMDMSQVGSESMGAAAGIYFSLGQVGGFIGQFMFGFFTDLTGGVLTSIVVLTMGVEAGLIFALVLKET